MQIGKQKQVRSLKIADKSKKSKSRIGTRNSGSDQYNTAPSRFSKARQKSSQGMQTDDAVSYNIDSAIKQQINTDIERHLGSS